VRGKCVVTGVCNTVIGKRVVTGLRITVAGNSPSIACHAVTVTASELTTAAQGVASRSTAMEGVRETLSAQPTTTMTNATMGGSKRVVSTASAMPVPEEETAPKSALPSSSAQTDSSTPTHCRR